jgi:hypothetical protein
MLPSRLALHRLDLNRVPNANECSNGTESEKLVAPRVRACRAAIAAGSISGPKFDVFGPMSALGEEVGEGVSARGRAGWNGRGVDFVRELGPDGGVGCGGCEVQRWRRGPRWAWKRRRGLTWP